MAGTLVLKNSTASYNRKAGRFVLKRTYHYIGVDLEDGIGLEYGALAADKVPASISITDPNGDAVICYPIDREAVKPETSGEDETWLTVSYEGLSMGPQYYDMEFESASELTLLGISGPFGIPRPLGADNEGTNVERPFLPMKILENITQADFMPDKINLILALQGSVNELGWQPDILDMAPLAFYEGQWLYLGAELNESAAGFALLHNFKMIPKYYEVGPEDLALFRWHPYVSRTTSIEIPEGSGTMVDRETRLYGAEDNEIVYKIAGEHMPELFDDLDL